jgi:nucleotide-binding universal stress UspA family protein
MRILLATDGSASAARARELVDRIEWPPETVIRVVAALERNSDLVGMPGQLTPSSDRRDIETSLVRRLDDSLDTAVRELSHGDRTVERILLRGRAASAIVQEAEDFEADLIVVGNRGHGRMNTMLLGSVSAEVVDHAPCPVLVSRGEDVTRILLAVDGSTPSEHAEHVLRDWPILAGRPVSVVCVAEVGMPWSTGMSPGIYDQVLESYTTAVDEARAQCLNFAEMTCERLRAAGYEATPEVREGGAAEEIVSAAKSVPVDLIVIGTRGHTGLARLVLGSVARNVLTHAHCSVLVVRERARVEPVAAPEPEAEAAGGGS